MRFLTRLSLLLPALFAGLATASEPVLERVFFTPERRAQLDRLRQAGAPAEAPARAEGALKLRGVVVRRDGRQTVFVNDAALDATQAAELSIKTIRGNTREMLITPNEGASRPIAVGTTEFDRSTGDAQSALGNGSVRVHRSPAR